MTQCHQLEAQVLLGSSGLVHLTPGSLYPFTGFPFTLSLSPWQSLFYFSTLSMSLPFLKKCIFPVPPSGGQRAHACRRPRTCPPSPPLRAASPGTFTEGVRAAVYTFYTETIQSIARGMDLSEFNLFRIQWDFWIFFFFYQIWGVFPHYFFIYTSCPSLTSLSLRLLLMHLFARWPGSHRSLCLCSFFFMFFFSVPHG